ncbi:MAG: hypothetical protein ACOCTQ_01510 [Planctomycetota bacterium]
MRDARCVMREAGCGVRGAGLRRWNELRIIDKRNNQGQRRRTANMGIGPLFTD